MKTTMTIERNGEEFEIEIEGYVTKDNVEDVTAEVDLSDAELDRAYDKLAEAAADSEYALYDGHREEY